MLESDIHLKIIYKKFTFILHRKYSFIHYTDQQVNDVQRNNCYLLEESYKTQIHCVGEMQGFLLAQHLVCALTTRC